MHYHLNFPFHDSRRAKHFQMCKSTKSVHLFKVHLFGILGLYGVDVAVLVELADRAEVVHVTVTLTQTSFKEDVKERVIKQKPVTLEDV